MKLTNIPLSRVFTPLALAGTLLACTTLNKKAVAEDWAKNDSSRSYCVINDQTFPIARIEEKPHETTITLKNEKIASDSIYDPASTYCDAIPHRNLITVAFIADTKTGAPIIFLDRENAREVTGWNADGSIGENRIVGMASLEDGIEDGSFVSDADTSFILDPNSGTATVYAKIGSNPFRKNIFTCKFNYD